jgi:plasmid stability protein
MHGRPMEDEARDIIRSALSHEPTRKGSLAASIRARFAPLGGVAGQTVPFAPILKELHASADRLEVRMRGRDGHAASRGAAQPG